MWNVDLRPLSVSDQRKTDGTVDFRYHVILQSFKRRNTCLDYLRISLFYVRNDTRCYSIDKTGD